MTQYRQGDVFLKRVDNIPSDLKARVQQKTILAYGEVTGHHHRFEGEHVTAFYKEGVELGMDGGGSGGRLRGTATDVRFISVLAGGAELLHEEHDTICVPEGDYEIVRQREFDMLEGVRRVQD